MELASGRELELVWRNDLGGLTFRFVDPFVKWNPRSTGIDLDRERVRLEWISARQPAPRVLDSGSDVSAQWLLLTALPGECAVGDLWRTRRAEAIRATATGLRALQPSRPLTSPSAGHLRGGLASARIAWGCAASRRACARAWGRVRPNNTHLPHGEWVGHVDLGDLAVGDKWADLAIASLSPTAPGCFFGAAIALVLPGIREPPPLPDQFTCLSTTLRSVEGAPLPGCRFPPRESRRRSG